jgi:hypothetical protein
VSDKKVEFFLKLQSAIDASKACISWSDIAVGVQRAIERKRQETVQSLLHGLSLEDLMKIEELTYKELGFNSAKNTIDVGNQASTAASGSSKASVQKRRPGRPAGKG